ncbi:MAG: hypothetical protein WBE26_13805 [Phycisphaerae bacterium]
MNSALERLRVLRAEGHLPENSDWSAGPLSVSWRPEITPADLPADWRIEWEERAAVREYEGGQAREHAEAETLRGIVERMKAAGEFP